MDSRQNSGIAWGLLGAGVLACLVVGSAACGALLDIDTIEFGDTTTTTGGSSIGGTGGTGAHGGHAGSGATGGHAGGTGGSGATGGSGGTPPPLEDCGDGVDDNSDGMTDCADPLCATSRCIGTGALPNNWHGPVVYYVGANGSVGCPWEWPTVVAEGGTSVSATPPSCTSCACGAPSGATCSAPLHSFWTVAGCSGSALATQTPTPGVCVPITASASLLESARADASVPTGGSCAESGGQPNNPAATFADHAIVCGGAPLGVGCSGTDACAPDPGAPFASTVCVWRSGGGSCNQVSPYSVKVTIYQSINDGRGCTSCSCGAPQGVSCSATTLLYSGAANNNCSGGSVPLTDDGSTCADGTDFGSMECNPSAPSGGSCTESSVTGTGSASGTGDVTLCCLP